MESSNLEMVPYNYASLTRRLGAFLIDGLIVGVVGMIGSSIIPFIGGLVVWFFYAPILESSEIRATLGKHLMGIQVADLSGRRLSIRASFVRNILKMVSAVIVFIGFFVALFTKRKQALHDLLADSVVVYGRSEAPIGDAWLENSKAVFQAGKSNFGMMTGPASGSETVVSQLERLQSLRAQGAISIEEYELAKKKILGV